MNAGIEQETSMKDVTHRETEKSHSAGGPQDEKAKVSRRLQNRYNVKKALEEIGQGKAPRSTIVEGTSPSYWVIRTAKQGTEQHRDADYFALRDDASRSQYELWRYRDGRGAMLRLSADADSYLVQHVAVRLVDANSGHCCVGLHFVAPAEPQIDSTTDNETSGTGEDVLDELSVEDRPIRCFMIVEDELSRNHQQLLQCLRRRKVVNINMMGLEKLLQRAPTIIVMPEAGRDAKYWELSQDYKDFTNSSDNDDTA
jgi:hypothetical protein